MMDKPTLTFYYGLILIAVGIGVFIRVPEVVEQVSAIEFFANKIGIVKFCSYTLGTMLIVAGGIRVIRNYKSSKKE